MFIPIIGKGVDTMSAASPNYVYSFGKKRPDAKPPTVITKERIEAAKKNVSKYLKADKK